MKITIKGLNSLSDKLDKVAAVNMQAGLLKGSLRVERTAKELVPVDTGTLRNSITHDVKENSATVGTSISYAPDVEFGIGQPAQAFLTPALQLNIEDIKQDIINDIQKQLGGIT